MNNRKEPRSGSKDQDKQVELSIADEFNTHDASFRRHYQLNYANHPQGYEPFYAQAYRFGYDLSEHNAGQSWEAVEANAQQTWASNYSTSWEEIDDAVHYGWIEERHPELLRVKH